MGEEIAIMITNVPATACGDFSSTSTCSFLIYANFNSIGNEIDLIALAKV